MGKKLDHVSQLHFDDHNPRVHTNRNREMIAASLSDVGFARSIVIDEDGTILAGNGVTQAALDAGLTKVQEIEADGETIIAVRRTGLTPEQKQRLKLFDNRAGDLGDYDAAVLLDNLQNGMDLGLFFDKKEINDLLSELITRQPASGEIPSAADFWAGMPEFEQDDLSAEYTIKVNFASLKDLQAFAQLVGQTITEHTKFIWHPYKAPANLVAHRVKANES